MNYAVIRSGGKQYRVTPGDVIRVEKLDVESGSEIEFSEVLLAGGDDGIRVGSPLLDGARVTGRVLAQEKSKKILIFKKKRRKNYRRRYGHRQPLTAVQVTAIDAGASHGA